MDCYFPAEFYSLREDLRDWCDAPAPGGVQESASAKIGGATPGNADPSWFAL